MSYPAIADALALGGISNAGLGPRQVLWRRGGRVLSLVGDLRRGLAGIAKIGMG
jgi:hypothetical protein